MKDEKDRGRSAHPLSYGSRMMTRDPALLVEEAEERTCRGCVHEHWVAIAGDTRGACSRNKRYGSRCREYESVDDV